MQAWQVFGSLYSGFCSRQIICCKSRLMAAQCREVVGPGSPFSHVHWSYRQIAIYVYRHSTITQRAQKNRKSLKLILFIFCSPFHRSNAKRKLLIWDDKLVFCYLTLYHCEWELKLSSSITASNKWCFSLDSSMHNDEILDKNLASLATSVCSVLRSRDGSEGTPSTLIWFLTTSREAGVLWRGRDVFCLGMQKHPCSRLHVAQLLEGFCLRCYFLLFSFLSTVEA